MNRSNRPRMSSARAVRKGEEPSSRSERRREQRRAERRETSNVVPLRVVAVTPVAVTPAKKVRAVAVKPAAVEVDIVGHVGKRIQLRRNQMGLSREAMAKRLKGLSVSGLQAIERGKKEASATLLFRLSVDLKVPVSFFYEGLAGFVDPIPARMRTAVQTLQATLR